MKETTDITGLVINIGEALGLIVTAIAKEHPEPLKLLGAMQMAVEQCAENPDLYSRVTHDLVLNASKGFEGAVQAAMVAAREHR